MSLSPLAIEFYALQSRYDVAMLLGVTEKGLRATLYGIPEEFRYRRFEIAKKSGGMRLIEAPVPLLMSLQRRLLRILTEVYTPKSATHGFVLDRGICTNAKLHVRRKNVLNLDLLDFFTSINFGRVRGMFMAEPYNRPPEVATVLAQICCHKNSLPQGAPTSPIVSNMVCARLDAHLIRLAKNCRCTYSRYADDITFSTGETEFSQDIAMILDGGGQLTDQLGKRLVRIIRNNGFQINESKTRLRCSRERQTVTGLVTNKKINPPREFIRNVRAMLHNWKTLGTDKCQLEFQLKYCSVDGKRKRTGRLFKEALRGRIDHIGTVRGKNDPLFLRFQQQLFALDAGLFGKKRRDGLRAIHDVHAHLLDNLWIVESTLTSNQVGRQGTGFFVSGFGIITCAHILPEDGFVEVYSRESPQNTQFAGVIFSDSILDIMVLSIRNEPEHSFSISTEWHAGQPIWLAGFPRFGPGKTGNLEPGEIIGSGPDVDGNSRFYINASIIEGNSGGPVLDQEMRVIGIAAKGVDVATPDKDKSFYEVIPIEALVRNFLPPISERIIEVS